MDGVWSDVTEERVVVGDRSLLVLLPRDSEALIDEERFAREEFLPYWAELWPSARALACAVAELPFAGLAVTELGCGLGLPSLVAAAAGARVLASDWAPEALPFVAENARRNGVVVDLLECSWAEPAALVARGPFDVVLASDVLYERANVPLIAALLPRLVRCGGLVLLADPGRPALDAFLAAMAAAGWATVSGAPVEGGRVVVHRLEPPPAGPAAGEARTRRIA